MPPTLYTLRALAAAARAHDRQARRARQAREGRDEAITQAHREGVALTDIMEAAGLSEAGVRGVLRTAGIILPRKPREPRP